MKKWILLPLFFLSACQTRTFNPAIAGQSGSQTTAEERANAAVKETPSVCIANKKTTLRSAPGTSSSDQLKEVQKEEKFGLLGTKPFSAGCDKIWLYLSTESGNVYGCSADFDCATRYAANGTQNKDDSSAAMDANGGKILEVAILDQPDGKTCAPTSATMLLHYFGKISDDKFNQETVFRIETRLNSGNSTGLSNAAELARAQWGLFAHGTNSGTRALIKKQIDAGRPVMVNTWFTSSGHIVLVVGYTNDGFVVNDPNGRYLGYQGGYDKSKPGKNVLVPYNKLQGAGFDDGDIWMATAGTKDFSL